LPYGDLLYVKGRLHLATNITPQDDEIGRMIQEADDFIDSMIAVFVSTPLNGIIPDQIRRLSNKLAVEWYYHYNTPLHPIDGVTNIKKEIEQYFRATYASQTDSMGQNRITKTASGMTGTEG